MLGQTLRPLRSPKQPSGKHSRETLLRSAPKATVSNPVLVFDDACGFCTWWADFVDARSPITVVGFSQLGKDERDRLPSTYEECAHLLTEAGVYSCGAAVEAALFRLDVVPQSLTQPGPIRQHPFYEGVRERVYQWVAANRDRLGWFVSKSPPASLDSG